jgi:hypothetical protein
MASHLSYRSPPVQWLTQAAIHHTGFTVEVNDTLTSDAAVDRARGRIEIRPGLSLPRFHIALGRSVLFVVFDETVVPEFHRAVQELPSGVIALHPRRRYDQHGLSLSS